MSDILKDFSAQELKLFKCFVNPKYPAAIRSLSAVAKESGLDEEEILRIYKLYDNVLFTQIDEVKWCFNVALFAKKFATKYTDIFEKFDVATTPLGVVVVPKDVSPEVIGQIIEKVTDELDDSMPGVAELLKTLNHMAQSKEQREIRPLSNSTDIVSFAA